MAGPAPDALGKVLSSLSGDKRSLLLILLDEMLLIELLDIDTRGTGGAPMRLLIK